MRLVGGKSGFKDVRDLILFFAGLTICFFHIFTTPSADLNWKLIIFGAGMGGLPVVFRQDERRGPRE